MSHSNGSPPRPSDFPTSDEYVDFAGRTRKFIIKLEEIARGFCVTAIEEVDGNDRFEFRAFSRVDPFEALADLRRRIPRLLSVRHLSQQHGKLSMTHDRLRGRIDYGGVVVDGIFLSFDQLAELIQTHEGFQFDLKFVEASGELE